MRNHLACILWVLGALYGALPYYARALELEEVRVNYRHFDESTRLLETPDFRAREALNLGLNVNLFGPFYWNNVVRSLSDDQGFRFISWNFFLGIRVFENFYIEYEHRSGHLLDTDQAHYVTNAGRFPLENSIGLQWYLYRAPSRKPASLF